MINKMLKEVKRVIEKEISPLLAMEGGSIELVSVEDGTVKVRLRGACAGCPMSQFTLVNFVEATLKEKIPEVKEVVAVDDSRERFEELWKR
ncbi:MAG: NifU family protein [Methanophagales archaeon]|nr:NifU family protein [Methanophagales archaeon]MCW3142186.1 NifU family protein [Methanophagales archaeon]